MRFSKLSRLLPATIFILSIAGAFTLTGTAVAASRSGVPILLRPSDAHGDVIYGSQYYQITAQPGSTTQLYAFVGNHSASHQGINLVPVDATSGEYGSISYDLPQHRHKVVSRWVWLKHRELRLSANQGAIVPFSIHVPRNTRPGQYIGALTAFVPAQRKQISKGIGLTVQTRVFNAILVTVPGPSHAAMIVKRVTAKYRSNQIYAIVHIKNTGTVLLKAHGFVWVYARGSNKPWIRRSISVDTTVPHTSVYYPLLWAHRVGAGKYRYAVRLRWSSGTYSLAEAHERVSWHSGVTWSRGYLRVP